MFNRILSKAVFIGVSLVLIISASVLHVDVQAKADPVTATPKQAQLTEYIDNLLETNFAADKPGAAVIVLSGGEVIYKSARGMANLELHVSLDADMVFRLGSITKQFTAAAIMLLVEEGKVSIKDEITRFLPDYPTRGVTITVEHLLTHTSGIRSYTDMPGWAETRSINHLTVEELIDSFKDEPLDFQPGLEFSYNNSGYILLGAIIEAVSGQTYSEFIQQRIFNPLHMNNSYYGERSAIINNRVAGYGGSMDEPVNSRYLSMTQPYAAGSLLSTVEDLGLWNTALFAGEVVSEKSLARMVASHKLADGSLTGYGYGLMPGEIRGHEAVTHGGGIFGFVTYGVYLPEDDIYVAVLCNSTALKPEMVGKKIAAMAAGDPLPELKKIVLADYDIYDDYVGEYELAPEFVIAITRRGDRLFGQATGQPAFELFPASETLFFLTVVEAELSFVRNENGKVNTLVLDQGGAKMPGSRK